MRAERVLADPQPKALLSEVSPQGLRWTLNFWMDAPLTGQGMVRSDVNLAVLASLRQAGVVLAAAPTEVVLRQ